MNLKQTIALIAMTPSVKTTLTKSQQQRLFALMGKDLRAVNSGQRDILCVTPMTPLAASDGEEMIARVQKMRSMAWDSAKKRLKKAMVMREKAKKERLKSVVGDDELFRLSYIPVVIGELVWDYGRHGHYACPPP